MSPPAPSPSNTRTNIQQQHCTCLCVKEVKFGEAETTYAKFSSSYRGTTDFYHMHTHVHTCICDLGPIQKVPYKKTVYPSRLRDARRPSVCLHTSVHEGGSETPPEHPRGPWHPINLTCSIAVQVLWDEQDSTDVDLTWTRLKRFSSSVQSERFFI